VGYIILIGFLVIVIPLVYVLVSRRPGRGAEGEKPIGKPVMVEKPSADEPTPDASSVQRDTAAAQRKTPPA
jgi:hypothetical protein